MIADIIIVAVLLISGVLAYFRGMVRESLTIAGWVGAALATIYGFPQFRHVFAKFIESTLFADIACAASLFVVTLVVLTIASHLIANRIKGSKVGQLDHALGFVFGVVRGVVLLALVYIGVTIFWEEKDLPQSVAEAKTMVVVKATAGLLENLMPEGVLPDRGKPADPIGDAVEEVGEAVEDAAKERLENMIGHTDAEEKARELSQPQPATRPDSAAGADATGEYSEAERREMQRLIENNQQEQQ